MLFLKTSSTDNSSVNVKHVGVHVGERVRHTSWLTKSAWKACQAMDGRYIPVFQASGWSQSEKALFRKARLCSSDYQGLPNRYSVSESLNSCLAALLDQGARIFEISSSLMKRTLPGADKFLLVHLHVMAADLQATTDGEMEWSDLLYVQPRAKCVLYLYSNSCSATSTSEVKHSAAGSKTCCWCVAWSRRREKDTHATMKHAQQCAWCFTLIVLDRQEWSGFVLLILIN